MNVYRLTIRRICMNDPKVGLSSKLRGQDSNLRPSAYETDELNRTALPRNNNKKTHVNKSQNRRGTQCWTRTSDLKFIKLVLNQLS